MFRRSLHAWVALTFQHYGRCFFMPHAEDTAEFTGVGDYFVPYYYFLDR